MLRWLNIAGFLLIMLPAFAAAPPLNPAREAFDNHDYAGYLTLVQPEIAQPRLVTFETLTRLAIALEKTMGWTTDTGKVVRAQVEKAPDGAREFDALHILLSGNARGAVTIYERRDLAPDFEFAAKSLKHLRAHGFDKAATAFIVVCPIGFGERISAWLHLPADQRPVIDQYMLARYPPKGQNRDAFIRVALAMYQTPPPGDLPADAYLDFACWFGKGTPTLSIDMATQMAQAGKPAAGVRIATQITPADDADVITRRRVGYFLQDADVPEALASYQADLKAMREPYIRELRQDYVVFVNALARRKPPVKDVPTLDALQKDADPLLAADALLQGKRFDDAAAAYRAVMADPKASFARKADAWKGWLDSDPDAALKFAPALLDAIAKHDPAVRGQELRWLGWQLHTCQEREAPLILPGSYLVERPLYRPDHLATGWETAMADVLTRLVAVDPAAVLQPDPQWDYHTLRYSVALADALASKTEAMTQVASQPITYEVPPPLGGWEIFPGALDKDPSKPRTKTGPAPGEAEQVTTDVMTVVKRYQAAKAATPNIPPVSTKPINTDLIIKLGGTLKALDKAETAKAQMRRFADQVTLAVLSLDPLPESVLIGDKPPACDVDMKNFAPIEQAIKDALSNTFAAAEALQLVAFGCKPGLLKVRHPALLDSIFDLTLYAYTRYVDVTKDQDRAAMSASTLANWLETCHYYDVKPYCTKLRALYPDSLFSNGNAGKPR